MPSETLRGLELIRRSILRDRLTQSLPPLESTAEQDHRLGELGTLLEHRASLLLGFRDPTELQLIVSQQERKPLALGKPLHAGPQSRDRPGGVALPCQDLMLPRSRSCRPRSLSLTSLSSVNSLAASSKAPAATCSRTFCSARSRRMPCFGSIASAVCAESPEM